MSLLSRARDLIALRTPPTAYEQRAASLATLAPPFQADKPAWPTASTASLIADYYKKSGLIFRCVNVVADAVAEAPLKVYRHVDGEPVEVADHPLRRLIRAPNDAMSESEFHVFTATLMCIAGFAAVEKQRSASGLPVRLWHLRPDWLRPIPRDNAPPDWQYKVPGRDPAVLPASEVIVIPFRADPAFGFTGVSPLAEILREAAIDTAATDFLKLIFDRGGVPPLALVAQAGAPVPQDRAAIEALRETWQQQFGGWQRWAKPPVLGNFTIEQVGFSPNDLAYPDLRALSEVRISQAFGVPPIVIGAQAGLNAATYSNFEQAMRTLQLHTANPLRARIDGALSRGLVPEYDPTGQISLEFDTDRIAALAEDETALWDRVGNGLLRGMLSVNDARARLGFPAVAGLLGEAFLLPRGSAFVDADGNLIASASGKGDVSAITGDPTTPPTAGAGATKAALPPPTIRQLPPGEAAHERRAVDGAARLGGRRLPAEQRARSVAAARGTITRLAQTHAPALATFWREQGRRIVDGMTRAAGDAPEARALGDTRAVNWDEERAALLLVLLALWADAGRQAFRQIAAELAVPLPFDDAAPHVQAFLAQVADRAALMTETTQTEVARTVADALAAGTTATALADTLTALFAGYGDARARTASVTEAHQSFSRAASLAYRASGKVVGAELHDNPDHNTDPLPPTNTTCADRDGLTVGLGDVDMYFDSAHINCILVSTPILAGQEE